MNWSMCKDAMDKIVLPIIRKSVKMGLCNDQGERKKESHRAQGQSNLKYEMRRMRALF